MSGSRLRSWEKTAVSAVEGHAVTRTKEGAAGLEYNIQACSSSLSTSGALFAENLPPPPKKKNCCEFWLLLDMWRKRNWLLHHDNAFVHVSLKTALLLTENNFTLVPQPPSSLDLALWVRLFPQNKLKPKGCRFNTTDRTQTESLAVLDGLQEKGFKRFFWFVKWL